MNIQASNNNFSQFGNNGFNGFQPQEFDLAKTKIAKEVAQRIFNRAGNPDTFSPGEFAKILGGLSTNLQNRNNIAATQNTNRIQSQTNTSSSAVEDTNTSPTTIDTNAFSQFAKQFDIDDNGLDQTELTNLIASLPEPPHHGRHHKGMREIANLNNLAQANGGSFTLDQGHFYKVEKAS